ncbi:MAG: hypothetical protein KAI29_04640 [Cyclobacteriaceae bacterium]|jgi:hypothetical protein|nr:hypothetical protein [Cyclobacteriaceae bacterium]
MQFSILRYEVKYYNENSWKEISETEAMERLQDAFDRVTPAIEIMIQGEQVLTPDAIYRIKGL